MGIAFALDVALELIEAEGYEAIFARHAACRRGHAGRPAAMGFQLFADPAHASNTVTSAHVPEGVEWSALSKELRGRGLVLAGGQGKLTGKVFRIGHLGDVHVDDIVRALETLEAGALALGIPVNAGVAVASARQAAEASGSSSQELAAVGASA